MADEVAHDHLGVGVQSRPRPHVANGLALRGGDVFVLRPDKAPDFVALQPTRLHIADQLVMEDEAGLASIDQQLPDGVDRHVRNPAAQRAVAIVASIGTAGLAPRPPHASDAMRSVSPYAKADVV